MDTKSQPGIISLEGLPRQASLFPPVLRVGYHENHTALPVKRKITDTQICIQFFSSSDPVTIRIDGTDHTEKCPRLYFKRFNEIHEIPVSDLHISSFYFVYSGDYGVEKILPPELKLKQIEITARIRSFIGSITELMPHAGEAGICDRLDGLCWSLLQELIITAQKDPLLPENGDIRISRIVSYLHGHFAEDFRWSELAGKFGFSERSFTRHWKKQMKGSPRQYVIALRLAEAERLLSESDMDIGSIARKTGYSTEVSFSFAFRRKNGITPAAFRRKMNGGNMR